MNIERIDIWNWIDVPWGKPIIEKASTHFYLQSLGIIG
jgi:hypothetical protein